MVTLGTGTFEVNENADIEPGRYTITPKSGSGNLMSDHDINVILGTETNDSLGQISSYTADLPKGDKIKLSGLESTQFTPVTTRSFITTLNAGEWEVGIDIKPGRYVITSLQGSGNISTNDGDINEILGKSQHRRYGETTSITSELKSGQILSTNLQQIRLTAK